MTTTPIIHFNAVTASFVRNCLIIVFIAAVVINTSIRSIIVPETTSAFDESKLKHTKMKGQSKIAYLPKFPKMITNLMMIMTWMLMIKNILKFKIVIMILPIIMTHLRKYTLLYHVPWYHCSKQELRRNRSNSRCDAIDDITILHSV